MGWPIWRHAQGMHEAHMFWTCSRHVHSRSRRRTCGKHCLFCRTYVAMILWIVRREARYFRAFLIFNTRMLTRFYVAVHIDFEYPIRYWICARTQIKGEWSNLMNSLVTGHQEKHPGEMRNFPGLLSHKSVLWGGAILCLSREYIFLKKSVILE